MLISCSRTANGRRESARTRSRRRSRYVDSTSNNSGARDSICILRRPAPLSLAPTIRSRISSNSASFGGGSCRETSPVRRREGGEEAAPNHPGDWRPRVGRPRNHDLEPVSSETLKPVEKCSRSSSHDRRWTAQNCRRQLAFPDGRRRSHSKHARSQTDPLAPSDPPPDGLAVKSGIPQLTCAEHAVLLRCICVDSRRIVDDGRDNSLPQTSMSTYLATKVQNVPDSGTVRTSNQICQAITLLR